MARTAKTASKASRTTAGDEEEPATFPTVPLIKLVLLVTALASASLATQLALHPLYGNTVTSVNHSKVVLLACLLSALFPHDSAGPSERITLLGLASWLAYAPYASYGIGRWSAKWSNPVLGPAGAEAAILLPTLSVGIILVRRWSFVAIAGLLTICAAFSPASAPSSKAKPGISTSSYKFALPFCLPVIVALMSLSLPPNSSPRPPYTRGTASPRASLSPTPPATVRVLASTHSVTGLILVGEHVREGFRFLRADHSLLGGRWVGDKVAPGSRNGLGDSIYTTFVVQEAVRLVEREKTKDERALVIGLGVGIAVEAFLAQQINTTVVEIDPAVYDYARRYFSLPEPNQVYIADAREWVHDHAFPAAQNKFDYIVHDCFSGGSVPGHIYTLEFWEELKGMVKSDGVVAVNFVGRLGSEPARAVFLTLQKTLGGCRAFHDHMETKFDDSYAFYNVVFFCTPLSSTAPTFRSASEGDYLSSHLRRHVLGAFARREVERNQILGVDKEPDLLEDGEEKWILRDGANRLEEWQQPDAIEHWTIMREVLPDVFWETY
ncbi:S-adenosyl-L-methionine-dependent methyltransferase [Gautieria morchelliformis]|nr:S-adenosyl-L-methionine-dependent methyltransferase [Gautieria morchelliformis]